MEYKERVNDHLEHVWSTKGAAELKRRIARGDYVGESKEAAEAFLGQKAEENISRYLLSPEHSALRAASAAERANMLMGEANATAQSARRIAGFAVLVALLAIVAQIFDVKL